jgi:hypothetical protein
LVEDGFTHNIVNIDLSACLGKVDFEDAVGGILRKVQAEF